jgi:hypothetical protein
LKGRGVLTAQPGGKAQLVGDALRLFGGETMNPGYGIILWIVIGALAGWVGSKIMGTDARQGGVANIIIGMIGAVVGGS